MEVDTAPPLVPDGCTEKKHDETSSTTSIHSTSDTPIYNIATTHDSTPQQTSNSNEKSSLPVQLARTLSRTSTIKDPGPPPDGGGKAWLQVLCAHFVVASCWGFITSWGVFQTYYTSSLAPLPPSTISWIGSLQTTLLFLVGIGSGRAMDGGYFRACFLSGATLQIAGVFAMSASTKFYQLALSQGICFGIGAGLVFTPTMALLATYFDKKRSFVMGISAAGSCTGGLVFPVLVRQLLPTIGFAWTVRIVGMFFSVSITTAFRWIWLAD